VRPLRGGHSISKQMLRWAVGSKSASPAQAATTLPERCLTVPSSSSPTGSSSGAGPISSPSSRSAQSRGSSPGSTSPFGIVQAPASRRAQNGPPGCASRNSTPSPRRRKSRTPALRTSLGTLSFYHHILVALDGSPDADAALVHATALARDQNARLTLLSVAAPDGAGPVGPGTAVPPDPVDLHSKILRQGTDSLPADVGVTTRLERGDPATTILRVATEEEHDLIVMGSHGHGRIRRALLGSVSGRVLADCRLPVLLMRGSVEPAPAPD